MNQYLDLLKKVRQEGKEKGDRTGTGTISVFGYQMRYDLSQNFPLLTTKKVHFKSMAYELLWFLKGDTNINYLKDNGVSIWDEWADDNGDLGPVYGKQWRKWEGLNGAHDQIKQVIEQIKSNPNSRRHIVSAWNVSDIQSMALAPCHILFQFYVVEGKLSCQLYQRSADVFLGVPFNIASYSLLIMMVADQLNLDYGEFVHTFGDVHIYDNHIEQCRKQINRKPRELPQVNITKGIESIFDYKFEDFTLNNYDPDDHIPAKVSV